jgi:hypothetical protein
MIRLVETGHAGGETIAVRWLLGAVALAIVVPILTNGAGRSRRPWWL